MERLLKKQESKPARGAMKRGPRRTWPVISYVLNDEGPKINLPPGVCFPMGASVPPAVPKPQLCSVPDCSNAKRYSSADTKSPICSLACYKKLKAILVPDRLVERFCAG